MTSADYLPLNHRPAFAATYLYRRRILLATILATSLFTLVVGFEYFFKDFPDLDGHSQIFNLSSEPVKNVYFPFPFDYDQSQSIPSPLLRSVHNLPSSCLEKHFTTSDLCHNPDIPPFNVLWTWVNGSDILLRKAKAIAEQAYADDDPYRPRKAANQDRQFRCVSSIELATLFSHARRRALQRS